MGRLAVVTGARRGLGRAITEELVTAGWSVVALVRPSGELLSAPGVDVVIADIRDPEVGAFVASRVGYRPLDLLVNNAASGAPPVGILEAHPDALIEAINVNVVGPYRLIQALIPNLLAADRPTIVNMSSRLASLAGQARGDYAHLPSSYAYRISKAAQNMLSVSLANEFVGSVRCLAVHPGALMTQMALADASKRPEIAARELLALVDREIIDEPRFYALGSDDLDW